MFKRVTSAFVFAAMMTTSAAFAQQATKAVNTTCPISGEGIDGKTFVEVDGKKVGFCCGGCDDAFLRWTDERKQAFLVKAQKQPPQATPVATKAVNAVCPISGKPVDGATFTEYKGNSVGVCCAGCIGMFQKWDEAKKDAFIQVSLAAAPQQPAPAQTADDKLGDPYPLATCIVSGEPLGSMGAPIIRKVNGREVRLCCNGCMRRFDAQSDSYMKKIDEAIVKDQLPHYPLDTCIVAGGALGSMGEPINHVYRNRLVRFCCAGCTPRFEADPAKYMKMLDDAVKQKQRASYPLKDCVVAGGALGSMGEPSEMVVANRLVRFCCAMCEKGFLDNPSSFIKKIDDAARARQNASAEERGN